MKKFLLLAFAIISAGPNAFADGKSDKKDILLEVQLSQVSRKAKSQLQFDWGIAYTNSDGRIGMKSDHTINKTCRVDGNEAIPSNEDCRFIEFVVNEDGKDLRVIDSGEEKSARRVKIYVQTGSWGNSARDTNLDSTQVKVISDSTSKNMAYQIEDATRNCVLQLIAGNKDCCETEIKDDGVKYTFSIMRK